jgi:prophage regulatory protein
MAVSRHAGGTPDGGNENPSPVLLGVEHVAELLGVSSRHVRRLADAGRCPQPVRLGGCVRWPRHVVEAWVAEGCPNCRKRPGVAR